MFLFDVAIAPWQPADSIAMLKLMAVQLSGHLKEEVLYARASLALDEPARLDDIMPVAPGTGIAALPDYASLFPELDAQAPRLASTDTDKPPFWPFSERELAGASNAWRQRHRGLPAVARCWPMTRI